MFYRHTIDEIKTVLKEAGYKAVKSSSAKPTPEHVLWMCEELTQLDAAPRNNATKAGRWIGWMLAVMELHFCHVWTNEKSRQLIRQDVQAGFADIQMYR